MTKTTNYEISKKLKEIGFDKETNFYFTEVAPDKFEAQYYTNNKEYLLLKSYELETLLDALPEINKQLPLICFSGITYLDPVNIGLSRNKNESLADTAGRLLILLYERNLIKF
jgi:hypothetical protein